jgi:hypothetical protein
MKLGKYSGEVSMIAYEDKIMPKVLNKVKWEFNRLQFMSQNILGYIAKYFKGWPIKGGKISHIIYPKGVQIAKG